MLDIKDNYCPLPWTSLYHQVGSNSPCHCIRHLTHTSPMEYVKSDERKQLKQQFVNNQFPTNCQNCTFRESMNLKSTRKEAIQVYNERYNFSKFSVDDDIDLVRLELRFSNLCNFKCRMCEPYSSSEIAKELIKYDNFVFKENPGESILRSEDRDIQELKQLAHQIKSLCLTGGEPFIIKEYYDFLDYLIENELNKNIEIEIFTNCSVYNPIMIEKLLKFKSVRFVVSVDGVGKTAEYIRHGTNWQTVKENILRFAKLPFEFYFNTAISQYTLLDVSNLAYFLMELYEVNKDIKTKCYAVVAPGILNFVNMPMHHRQRAAEEIDKAVEILKPSNFDIFKKEILGMKKALETKQPIHQNAYIDFTEMLDKRRNESFEDTFGLRLR